MLSSLQTSALLMVGLLFTALSAAENSVCASCGTKPVNADIAVATFKPNLGPKVGGAKAVEVEVGFCSQGCHDAFAADPSAHAESATKACCSVAQTSCIVCDKKPVDAKIPVISFQPNPTPKAGNMKPVMLGFCSMVCHDNYVADPAKYESQALPAWQKARNQQVK